jgi:hypothetical protein
MAAGQAFWAQQTGWYKQLDADVRQLCGRLGQYFAGRRAQTWFAAICARWGVACTAQGGGRRAISQATARRPSTSSDDKLR